MNQIQNYWSKSHIFNPAEQRNLSRETTNVANEMH